MLVSVIIPVYNAESSIKNCLETITSQSYKKLQIIVVNDGSTDDSMYLVEKMINNDNRIILINQNNLGVSAARNCGIRNADGKFITFVDADDELSHNMIETMVEYQFEYNVDLVKTSIRHVEVNGKVNIYASTQEHYYPSRNSIMSNFFEILSNELNSPVAKLYKCNVIQDNSIFFDENLDLAEDLHFNLHYLEKIDSAYFNPNDFYIYKKTHSQLTKKYRRNLFEQRIVSINLMEQFLLKHKLKPEMIYFMIVKLVVASAMQDVQYNVPRAQMHLSIRKNLSRKKVTEAIVKYRATNMYERIVFYSVKLKSPLVIEMLSRLIILFKKCTFVNINRVSV